jgi:hypothetical protein
MGGYGGLPGPDKDVNPRQHYGSDLQDYRPRSNDNGCSLFFWIGFIVLAALAIAEVVLRDYGEQIKIILLILAPLLIVGAVLYIRYRRQFDYEDFVWEWQTERPWFEPAGSQIFGTAGTKEEQEQGARLWFWQSFQTEITEELQKRQDAGWEIRSNVGPKSFRVARRKRMLGAKVRYEAQEFRVEMRKRKAKEGNTIDVQKMDQTKSR